jgi:RNA polymerase-associated protein
MPVDPVSRASNRLFRYRIKRDIYGLIDRLGEGGGDESRRELRDHLTAVSPMFLHKPYFMSDEFSLVDCLLAPVLWRLPRYGIQLQAQARPLLQYADRLFQRESFRQSLTEVEREMR